MTQVEWDSREDDHQFKEWAREVKKRDGYTCQICGISGTYMEAHHLNGWNWAIEERYDIFNGTTLCSTHHKNFHDQYGYGNNTKFQYYEYVKISEILKIIIDKEIDSYNL